MATGGCFTTKSKDLSLYTVMITGRTFPALSWVRALNCLQKSMILTPFEPSAGPTGGAGFAAPPFICSLINAATSVAIVLPGEFPFFNFHETQLHTSLASEYLHGNRKLLAVVVDGLDDPRKTGERSVRNLDRLAHEERHFVFLFALTQFVYPAE